MSGKAHSNRPIAVSKMAAHRWVASIETLGIERVAFAKYVYVFQVHWSDGGISMTKRRFGELFDFHCSLLDHFPDYAGSREKPRIIPSFPGKQLLR